MVTEATPRRLPADPAPSRMAELVTEDLRRVAAAATAGMVAGFLVNGWGSRLAMMLLARLNPRATGLVSDDGFVIGTFDLADTLSLVLVGTVAGVIGGVLYLALRGLRFGPDWFRTTSMVVGPAVVVGAVLVHSDGVDFRVLEPTWLAIALFVALPGLFAASVMTLVDRWVAPDSAFLTSRWGWMLGLVPLVALGPGLVIGAVAVGCRQLQLRTALLRRPAVRATGRTVARVALAVLFLYSLVDLTRDTLTLL